MTPFAAGLIGLAIIVFALYAAFIHKYPWQNPYELKATFANANNLALNSPVRVAGVTVGKSTKSETKQGSSASVVPSALVDPALPIHTAAPVKISPPIFLEGHFPV